VASLRGVRAWIVATALLVSGCGTSGTLAPAPPRPPETLAHHAAVHVVRAYDRAIREDDPDAACRVVGGAELDAFNCRTRPSIPRDRRAVFTDPADLGVHVEESRNGSIVVGGGAKGTTEALLLTVKHARDGLRVTHVYVGYRF
jgi:hypothetical protein